MIEWKRICCPVDFSSPSRAAMELAAGLAEHFKAELTLLYVLPQPAPAAGEIASENESVEPAPRQRMEMLVSWRMEAEDRAGRPSRSFILQGDPASEILQHAVREGYDLLILGTHGRTGVARLFLGSVAERVARRAPCPVLFVRDQVVAELRDNEEEFALYR